MKKTMIAVALTGLILNSTYTGIEVANNLLKTGKDVNPKINPNKITQFVEQTALIPKSLIISQRQQFTTDQILKDMNHSINGSIKWILPDVNQGASGFIKNLTTKLDYQSTANIQAKFISNGANQSKIDAINQKINQLTNLKQYISQQKLQAYLNNQYLSQPAIFKIFEAWIASAKTSMPTVVSGLQNVKYVGILKAAISSIITEWDQQKKWGETPAIAIEKYMADPKTDGCLSQAKAINKWNLVKDIAKNWQWNDFYQYIAGVNFNYLIKELSNGKYIGDLITENIETGWFNIPKGFNQPKFSAAITTALSKLPEHPELWKYLVAAIVPMIKSNPELLNLNEPTKAVNYITWKDNDNKTAVAIEPFLDKIIQLLDPSNKQQLVNLIASLLSGQSTFAQDIIINVPVLGNKTLPSLLTSHLVSWFISSLHPEKIAGQLADLFYNTIDKLDLNTKIASWTKFIDSNLLDNPTIDLKDFNQYFQLIFGEKFSTAFNQLQDAIDKPQKSAFNAKTILTTLGVNYQTKSDFVKDSPLATLKSWLFRPNSSLNQIFNIIINGKNSIFEQYLLNLNHDLTEDYQKYFDLHNTSFFQTTNIQLINHPNKAREQYELTYDLIDNTTKETYQLSFVASKLENPIFLLNQFHKIK